MSGRADEMHPTEEELLAYVDGAMARDDAGRVGRHVARCAPCVATIREIAALDASLSDAVRELDANEPAHWQHKPPVRATRAASIPLMRWAAVVLICAAGIASAATFVRARYASRDAARPLAETSRPARAESPAAVIVPAAESALVVVQGAGSGSRVMLTHAEATQAGVRVEVGGVASPVFQPGRSGVVSVVLDGQSATVRIAVPDRVRLARVEVNGRVLAQLIGGVITPVDAGRNGIVVTW